MGFIKRTKSESFEPIKKEFLSPSEDQEEQQEDSQLGSLLSRIGRKLQASKNKPNDSAR